jgi:hypothetical protein
VIPLIELVGNAVKFPPDPSKPNHIKKKDSVLHLIRNGYNHFYYYDDDHKNLKAVKSLEEEFKHVKINIFEC